MDLAEVPVEATVFALLALYEEVADYEEFCEELDLDPQTPEAETFFEDVHRSYADLWKEMGDDAFVDAIKAHRGYIA